MPRTLVNQNELHSAIWKWLFEGSNGISELSFLAAQYDKDGNIISDSRVVYTPMTMGASTVLKKYMRRANRVQYDFTLKQYAPTSTQSNTPANLKVTEVFEGLVEWVSTQWDLGNLPIMPKHCRLEDIIVNSGTVSGSDDNGTEFMVIINLIYMEGV